MSGYRNIHRESVGSYPIWQVVTSPILTKKSIHQQQQQQQHAGPSWRVWTACGDGIVRGYVIREKTLEMQKDVLDASACNCTCTHELTLSSVSSSSSSSTTTADHRLTLGCSQVCMVRNYVGDDDTAGDMIVAAMDLAGNISIWLLPEDMDDNDDDDDDKQILQPLHAFHVDNATGTSCKICPPKQAGVGNVYLAVPCLDGTVALVATGIVTPNNKKEPLAAGTIIDRLSKPGPIAMVCDWHPLRLELVIGRQDGCVDILGVGRNSNSNHSNGNGSTKPRRLIHHEAPVRVVSFTSDGNQLITCSDDGMLAVWDVSRLVTSPPTLVRHVTQAHGSANGGGGGGGGGGGSWILGLAVLSDSRRFLTCGADRKLHVWNVSQMDQSMHTFACDDTVWSIHSTSSNVQGQQQQQHLQHLSTKQPPRLVSGSEKGILQIYSLEA